MKVRDEIEQYAAEEDKPALRWLLKNYMDNDKWDVVAIGSWTRNSGVVWTPTKEGRILYLGRLGCFL